MKEIITDQRLGDFKVGHNYHPNRVIKIYTYRDSPNTGHMRVIYLHKPSAFDVDSLPRIPLEIESFQGSTEGLPNQPMFVRSLDTEREFARIDYLSEFGCFLIPTRKQFLKEQPFLSHWKSLYRKWTRK